MPLKSFVFCHVEIAIQEGIPGRQHDDDRTGTADITKPTFHSLSKVTNR